MVVPLDIAVVVPTKGIEIQDLVELQDKLSLRDQKVLPKQGLVIVPKKDYED